MAVGGGGKGVGDGSCDFAVMGDDIKGGGTDGVALQDHELGSDRCDAGGAGGVPPQSCFGGLQE